jgi:hypothetical protein
MKLENVFYTFSVIFGLASLVFFYFTMISFASLLIIGSVIFLMRGLYEDFDNIEY